MSLDAADTDKLMRDRKIIVNRRKGFIIKIDEVLGIDGTDDRVFAKVLNVTDRGGTGPKMLNSNYLEIKSL